MCPALRALRALASAAESLALVLSTQTPVAAALEDQMTSSEFCRHICMECTYIYFCKFKSIDRISCSLLHLSLSFSVPPCLETWICYWRNNSHSAKLVEVVYENHTSTNISKHKNVINETTNISGINWVIVCTSN